MTPRTFFPVFAVLTVLISSSHATAESFAVKHDAILFMKPMGGGAGAVTEFGIGTAPDKTLPVFKGLPFSPDPSDEVLVGFVRAGTVLHFYQKTEWNGATHWAFSNGNDEASLIAFRDFDNSLGFNGSVIEKTGKNTWLLHLDDAASLGYDDDDDDVLIQIRLVRIPRDSNP